MTRPDIEAIRERGVECARSGQRLSLDDFISLIAHIDALEAEREDLILVQVMEGDKRILLDIEAARERVRIGERITELLKICRTQKARNDALEASLRAAVDSCMTPVSGNLCKYIGRGPGRRSDRCSSCRAALALLYGSE